MISLLIIFISLVFSLIIAIWKDLWGFFGGYLFCFAVFIIAAIAFKNEERERESQCKEMVEDLFFKDED